MAEKVQKSEKTPLTTRIKNWWHGLTAEFRKIIWPTQQTVVRQTIAVVSTSVVVGLIIALIDWVAQYGVNFLVGLSF